MPGNATRLDERPLEALAATLDLAEPPSEPFLFVPPLWHWLYFLPHPRRRKLGVDGHPADPTLSIGEHRERRMFAAARTQFHRPLRTGEMAEMTEISRGSRVVEGKSGRLRIVTLEYRYMQAGELCILEERDIVYLPAVIREVSTIPNATPNNMSDVAPVSSFSQKFTPDPAMLFRFSALTFNAHRIHYDQTFAQVNEGHAERVVHGPLTAILLADLLRRRGMAISRFEFRARRPLFVNATIDLQATFEDGRAALRAIGPDGETGMEASAWINH